tara:strand:- start:2646 stop:4346 length:1701 start_codon:yes stop_codon:yes gene_type:complete
MVQMYIPEQKEDKNITNQYYDLQKAGTMDVLGASFQETLYYNPLNALNRLGEQYIGKGTQGETISKEAWAESEYYRAGIDVGESGIKTGLAQLLADRVDKRTNFQTTLSRSEGGFGLGAAQFGVAIAGSFLDPLNVASAFIPVIGPARMAVMASKLGKSGSRAMAGVIDGAVGAAVVEPLVIGAAAAEQDKSYTMLDSFLNIAVGSALGGIMHVGFGKIGDRLNKISPQTRELAGKTAIGQSLGDTQVKVDNIISEAETTTIKAEADQPERITVYDSEGQPRSVEKVSVDEEGIVTIKDSDGTEKVVDQSDVLSKSVYDEDYKIEMTLGSDARGGAVSDMSTTLTEIKQTSRDNKSYIENLEKSKEITELEIELQKEGRVVKEGIFRKEKKVINEEKLVKLSATLKAINLALRRANGEAVVRPKDPVTNQVTETGLQDVNTTESIVQTQEGAGLTPQQLDDQKNSAILGQDNLGRLDAYAEKVDEINADTTDLGEIKAEDIETENEAMLLELDDPEIIANLPDVAKDTLQGVRASMKAIDESAEKARISYDAATQAGANCVLRGKS